MPTLENKDTDNLQLPAASPKAKAELEHWEHLVFSFGMDDERSSTGEGSSRKSQRSRSSPSTQPGDLSRESGINNPDLLARIQGAPGSNTELDQAFIHLISQNQHPPPSSSVGSYSNPPHHGAAPHPGISSTTSPDFLWNQLAHQQRYHQLYTLQNQAQMIPPYLYPPHNNFIPLLVPVPPGNGGGWGISGAVFPPSAQQPTPSGPVATAPPPPPSASSTSGTEVDPAEDDQTVVAEEKRRRNTAASVRFRIKKKQKTISLERSVSELTGRADDLEKEVADLRRENGWLKEIVMLKSTRHVTQQRQPLSGSSQGAGIDEGGQASTSSSVPSPPRTVTISGESSDDESANNHPKADKKGKGKKSSSKGGRK